jgi:hypothetical protein
MVRVRHGSGIAALLALAMPDLVAAQAQRIRVGPNVHVSQSRERSPYQEVVIASDPAEPTRLITCTMLEPMEVEATPFAPRPEVKFTEWVCRLGRS